MNEINNKDKKAIELYTKLSEEQQKQIYWMMMGYVISNGACVSDIMKENIAS